MTSRIIGLAISTCSGASETHDVWNSWIRSPKSISNNDDAVESCLIVLWRRGSPSHPVTVLKLALTRSESLVLEWIFHEIPFLLVI